MSAVRTYKTQSGDWWDLVAIRVYGLHRGDEYGMNALIEANYRYRYTYRFLNGIELVIPELPPREVKPLVPWTTARNVS